MAGKLAEILMGHAESVFSGPNGDYPAVLEALEGIGVDRAGWKPARGANSIWQIVDHLTGSNTWEVEMLEKGQAAPPTWTEPAGGEAAWSESLRRLRQTHTELMEALGTLTDEKLLGVPVPEWKKTLFELMLSSAAHEACHAGQIDYLKGLQAE